jgi:hypothetical protein
LNEVRKSFLVEDNDLDAEFTIRALKTGRLANKLLRVNDGQEALDYLFRAGEYAGRGGHRAAAGAS